MSPLRQIKNLFTGSTAAEDSKKIDYIPIPAETTLFHITHWKAGSQWIKAVVEDIFGPDAVVPAENFESQVLNKPILPQKLYTCVYLGKPEFDALAKPGKTKQFVLIRDLRDALISGYFSIRYSHSIETGPMGKWRQVLSVLDKEAGITYLMEVWLPQLANIQRTWLKAGVRCYRLEDFAQSEVELFDEMFREGWGISVEREKLVEVMSRRSFEKMAGRERGTEDVKSHYRKGISGDWKQHFTPKMTERFKVLYNDILLASGYEKDNAWTA